MKNKKILIISGIVIVLIALSFLLVKIYQRNQAIRLAANNPSVNFKPDFLSNEEKKALGISSDARLQALTRNASGTVMVYKIIRADSDIINTEENAPATPRP